MYIYRPISVSPATSRNKRYVLFSGGVVVGGFSICKGGRMWCLACQCFVSAFTYIRLYLSSYKKFLSFISNIFLILATGLFHNLTNILVFNEYNGQASIYNVQQQIASL